MKKAEKHKLEREPYTNPYRGNTVMNSVPRQGHGIKFTGKNKIPHAGFSCGRKR